MSIRSIVRPFVNASRAAARYPLSKRIRVFVDYLYLFYYKGITVSEYVQFDLLNQPRAFRSSFLGLNEQRLYLDVLNPKKYYILSRNKYLAHLTLEAAGVPMPELYCYYSPKGRYGEEGEKKPVYDFQTLFQTLKSMAINSCVIKTTETSHGDNVMVIKEIEYNEKDAILHRFDGTTLLLSQLIGREDLIFEAVVTQTSQFSKFNPSSVNTVRFMTTLCPNGEAQVIATWMKVGRSGKCIDNAGSGGNIDMSVDVNTGEILDPVQFDGWGKVRAIEKHPDSGEQLNRVFIENWDNIKNQVISFQQAFPFCRAAGWDIAITNDGPVVIEVNDFWDRIGQFFIKSGWRREIRNCYNEWIRAGGDASFGRMDNYLSPRHLKRIVSKEY